MVTLYTVPQRVPANVKDLILCDVTGKGVIELVVSLTDRVVRTYRCKKAFQKDSSRIPKTSCKEW